MIKIYNYIEASDLANFVEFEFGIKSRKVYDILLDDDYIEGRLGSIYTLGEISDDENEDIRKWIEAFMERYEVLEIQLKY